MTHYCQRKMNSFHGSGVSAAMMVNPDDPQCCGKIARFCDEQGLWYCAEHWDEYHEWYHRECEKLEY